MNPRPLAQRLVHGTLWSFISRVWDIGATFVGTVLLARYLSKADMGTFFLAASAVQVAKRIGQYGLLRVTVRRVSEALALKDRAHAARVGRDVMTFGLWFMTGTFLLIWLFVLPWLPTLVSLAAPIAEMKHYILLWAAAMVVVSLASAVNRGFHDYATSSLVGTALEPTLITAGYLLLFFFTTAHTLSVVVPVTAMMEVLAAIIALGFLLRPLRDPVRSVQQDWKQLMSGATPFWINSVALLLLSSAGLWVLGAYHSGNDVAIYGAAMKLIAAAIGMTGIVQPVLQPAISDSYARKDYVRLGRALRAAGLVTGLPTILICLTFIVLPGLWMEIVFGPAYRDGAGVLVALSVGYLIAAFIGLPGVALDMTDAQKKYMFATLGTGGVTLAAIFLVAPGYGAFWMAIVVSAGLVLQRIVFWAMLRQHAQVRSDLFLAKPGDLQSAATLVIQMIRRRAGREKEK